jgi:hypothetical protein
MNMALYRARPYRSWALSGLRRPVHHVQLHEAAAIVAHLLVDVVEDSYCRSIADADARETAARIRGFSEETEW